MNAADSIRAPMASARKSNREESSLLIKQTLAKKLRDEIIHGRLAPGERIVEGNWARRFGDRAATAGIAESVYSSLGHVPELVSKWRGKVLPIGPYLAAHRDERVQFEYAFLGRGYLARPQFDSPCAMPRHAAAKKNRHVFGHPQRPVYR